MSTYHAALRQCADRYLHMQEMAADRLDTKLFRFTLEFQAGCRDRMPVPKLCRWLGYIQGLLIERGLTTVEVERDWSRPLFRPLDYPADPVEDDPRTGASDWAPSNAIPEALMTDRAERADSPSIRERREALGWTQWQLARVAGLRHAAYVSLAEHGRVLSHRARAAIGSALDHEEMLRSQTVRVTALEAEQQALITAMPASPEWDALRAAMVSRAIDMLDAGHSEACDAILEFIPDDEARRALDEYFGREDPADGR